MGKIKKKEMKEIALVLGSVFLVAIVGVALHFSQQNKIEALAGAAVQLDNTLPTYPGSLVLLKDYCSVVSGTGSCNTVCGTEKICVPIETDCSVTNSKATNCLCCSYPK